MNCKNCGKEISDDFIVCPYCGQTTQTIGDEALELNKSDGLSASQANTIETNEQKPFVETKSENKLKVMFDYCKKKKYPFVILGLIIIVFIFSLLHGPKVVKIEAEYTGDTQADIVLDKSNDGIDVMGIDENGEKRIIHSWTVDKPETLSPDTTSTITISYKDFSTKLSVECSSSITTNIKASYSGDLSSGAVVKSDDISVTAVLRNGQEEDISDNCIFSPESVTMEKDGSHEISVTYKDPFTDEEFKDVLVLDCSTLTITKITASYSGDTKAGTVLDEKNDDITVIGTLKDGKTKELNDWTVEKSITLKQDETSTVKIKYENLSCDLKVECSTVSDAKYKEKCKSISYSELARNPKTYKGKNVKFTGKVVQVMEGSFYKVYRINVTNKGYGYYDDTVYVTFYTLSDSDRILEDDIVTFYGEYTGLKSYETIMGATVTIPAVTAKYIDR